MIRQQLLACLAIIIKRTWLDTSIQDRMTAFNQIIQMYKSPLQVSEDLVLPLFQLLD